MGDKWNGPGQGISAASKTTGWPRVSPLGNHDMKKRQGRPAKRCRDGLDKYWSNTIRQIETNILNWEKHHIMKLYLNVLLTSFAFFLESSFLLASASFLQLWFLRKTCYTLTGCQCMVCLYILYTAKLYWFVSSHAEINIAVGVFLHFVINMYSGQWLSDTHILLIKHTYLYRCLTDILVK